MDGATRLTVRSVHAITSALRARLFVKGLCVGMTSVTGSTLEIVITDGTTRPLLSWVKFSVSTNQF